MRYWREGSAQKWEEGFGWSFRSGGPCLLLSTDLAKVWVAIFIHVVPLSMSMCLSYKGHCSFLLFFFPSKLIIR